MTLSWLMVHLAGAVVLLLWAVRMVRTGVERAHGPALKRGLQAAKGGRLQAALTGAGSAVLLQGSTAVALIAAGLTASGIVAGPAAVAMLLGADFGSSLVVLILSFKLDWLVPLLLIVGGLLFLKGSARSVRQTGRILVGIALVLVALGMVGEATAPLRESETLPTIVGYLSEDPLTAFLIGAAFTWLIHSSVASILLMATLAGDGLIPVGLGVALVLGANAGSGVIPVALTRALPGLARRVPVVNAVLRGAMALLALGVWQLLQPGLALAGTGAAAELVGLHVVFNLVLLLVCLPFTGWAYDQAARLVSDAPSDSAERQRPSALDRGLIDQPQQALASATREVLHMAEIVDAMLRPVMDLYDSGDRERMKAVRRMDAEVNQAHSDIKLYLAEVNRSEMSEEDARRSLDLNNFAINLEHIGDVIAKGLLKLADEKAAERLTFSPEGWRELTDLHDRVLANMQLALNVLVSGDRDSARQLIGEKDRMRELERRSHERHLGRLQSGTIRSVETSEIHLETIRALKQINSLFATVAYPILAEAGELLETRLAQHGT